MLQGLRRWDWERTQENKWEKNLGYFSEAHKPVANKLTMTVREKTAKTTTKKKVKSVSILGSICNRKGNEVIWTVIQLHWKSENVIFSVVFSMIQNVKECKKDDCLS